MRPPSQSHGSGFPTAANTPSDAAGRRAHSAFVDSPWNLNNLPLSVRPLFGNRNGRGVAWYTPFDTPVLTLDVTV